MEQTNKKPTGLEAISSTLSRGSTGDAVKALQQYLNGLGYDVGKVDSIYGPKVEAAVRQFQADNGLKSDGYFGTQSLGKAKTLGVSATPAANAGSVPTTQEALDRMYADAVVSHPAFKGNSPEALNNAVLTGDFSGLLNPEGLPFSQADQDEALRMSEDALRPGFDIMKKKDTEDTEASLEEKLRGYNEFLDTESENFSQDKANLDQDAANRGVLFSGGRAQKEKMLGNNYTQKNNNRLAEYTKSVGDVARDYQYKYGDESAGKLSSLYNLGGNTYNPNTARNGVGSRSLSAVYNPAGGGYQGTANVLNKTEALKRSAGLLWNKGNKLLSTGYGNKY